MQENMKKITGGYLILMFLVYPLVYHNQYIDILQTKKYVFLGITLCYVLISCISFFALKKQNWEWNWNPVDLFAGIYVIGLILSTILAGDRIDAFWGSEGRCFGAVVLIAGVAAYLLISRFCVMSQNILWAFLIGSGIVFVLDIINTFQMDLLGMKESLVPEQHYFFIGTMGNIDVSAGYVAIMLPVGMVLFYYAKEKFAKTIYGIHSFLGFAAMLCCRCDTAVLCVGMAFLVLYWFAMLSEERLKKAQMLYLLWIVSSIGISVLRQLFPSHVYEFDGVALLAVSMPMIALEILVWSILQVYVVWMQKQKKEGKFVRNLVYGILFAFAGMILILFVVANVLPQEQITGSLLETCRITDEFGNYRGYIWTRSWEAWKNAPLMRKLFGYGTNQFPVFIQAYEEDMISRYQLPFIDAHNEFLHMLATLGMIGCVGYFGMLISCLWMCRKKMRTEENMPAMLGMIVWSVYFVQAITNNVQVFTTPLYFVMLGIVVRQNWVNCTKNHK